MKVKDKNNVLKHTTHTNIPYMNNTIYHVYSIHYTQTPHYTMHTHCVLHHTHNISDAYIVYIARHMYHTPTYHTCINIYIHIIKHQAMMDEIFRNIKETDVRTTGLYL